MVVHHKRVCRLYRDDGLSLRLNKPRRNVGAATRDRQPAAAAANEMWSMDFSRPGKPTDNALVESFNGRPRDECLNTHWFLSLEDARAKIEAWRRDYNENRPPTSLGWRTPIELLLPRLSTRPNERRILTLDQDEKPGDPQDRVGSDFNQPENGSRTHMPGKLLQVRMMERKNISPAAATAAQGSRPVADQAIRDADVAER